MTEIRLAQHYDLGKIVDAIVIPNEVKCPGCPNTREIHTPDLVYALNEWFTPYVEKARQVIGKHGESKEDLFYQKGASRVIVISSGDDIYAISFQRKTTKYGGNYFEIKKRTNVEELKF